MLAKPSRGKRATHVSIPIVQDSPFRCQIRPTRSHEPSRWMCFALHMVVGSSLVLIHCSWLNDKLREAKPLDRYERLEHASTVWYTLVLCGMPSYFGAVRST